MIFFIGNQLFSEFPTCTIEECYDYLVTQEVIGIDIETSRKFPKRTYPEEVYAPGLDPYVSRVVMLQIGTLERQYVIDTRVVDISKLKSIVESDKIVKVGHNLQFEYKHILHNFGFKFANIWDTFICEKVLYNGLKLSYSLESLAKRYLGLESVESIDLFNSDTEDEEISKAYINKSTRLGFINIGDNPFSKTQIEYGVDDVIFPLKIKAIQEQGRDGWNPKLAFRLENTTVLALADMAYRGIGFDKVKWLELLEIQKPLYVSRKEILNRWVEENEPTFCRGNDLFSNTPTCGIEWQSPTQVVTLFKKLGICPREKSKSTGKLEWTVGAKELLKTMTIELQEAYTYGKDKLIETYEDLKLAYLLFKRSQMLCTTFGKDWLNYVHPITYRVHSNFNQYMHSSRLSSNNPNIQNLPQGRYRDAFVSSNGFIACDYSAQEVRVLADVSDNQVMQDFFINGSELFGDDFHSFSATNMMRAKTGDDTLVVSKKTHNKERNISKALTFSLSYGGSAHSIKFKLNLDEENTEAFIKSFFDGFPGLREDFDKRKNLAVKHGYITLDAATDRRYFFPYFEEMNAAKVTAKASEKSSAEAKAAWKTYFTLRGKLERRALNYPIQGLSAGMSKLALILAYNKGVELTSCIHDEICCEGREEEASTLEWCMIEAGRFFCKKVPMTAHAEIGDCWIH